LEEVQLEVSEEVLLEVLEGDLGVVLAVVQELALEVEVVEDVDRFPDSSVTQFRNSNVGMFPDSSVRMFLNKSAGVFQDSSAGVCQDSSVEVFLNKNVLSSVVPYLGVKSAIEVNCN